LKTIHPYAARKVFAASVGVKGAISEGVEDSHGEAGKIAFVARGYGESMDACSARDHSVFGQRIGSPLDQAGVLTKASCIHG